MERTTWWACLLRSFSVLTLTVVICLGQKTLAQSAQPSDSKGDSGKVPSTGNNPKPTDSSGESAEQAIPSLVEIRSVMREELNETRALLDEIRSEIPKPTSTLEEYQTNLVADFIWEILLSPIVAKIIGLIASIGFVTKTLAFLRIKRQRKAGRDASASAKLLNSLGNGFLLTVVLFLSVVFLSLVFFRFTAPSPSFPTAKIMSVQGDTDRIHQIDQRLDRLDQLLTGVRGAGYSTIDLNPVLVFITAVSVLGMLVIAVTAARHDLQPDVATRFSSDNRAIDLQRLSTPLILVIILLLLPYPVDSLMFPFIVTYFITAFFDVLTIYPHPTFVRIVTTRYSSLIYLAHFGAWSGFFSVSRHFMEPLWDAWHSFGYLRSSVTQFGNLDRVLSYAWTWWPFLLALVVAYPRSRQEIRAAANNHIPAIQQALQSALGDNEA